MNSTSVKSPARTLHRNYAPLGLSAMWWGMAHLSLVAEVAAADVNGERHYICVVSAECELHSRPER